ncbi:protein PHLOEM PROTEIN 2-LIKE A10-like [Solanum verrucosum]|nr:protein PHLOEM PROTEIN 2-LIKE A10-like [Solanum verrucosum]
MESYSSKIFSSSFSSSSSSFAGHDQHEETKEKPYLSSLHRVRSLSSRSINKKPIAPSPPIPPKIYRVEVVNFRQVVQMLTGAPEFQSHSNPGHSREVAPPPPPPLDLSPTYSLSSKSNIGGQWREFLPPCSSMLISNDEVSNESIIEAGEKHIEPNSTTFGACGDFALNCMDMKQIKKGMGYTQKNKNLLVALGALGITGFGAYKAYYSPSMVKKRKRLLKFLGSVVSLAEMVSNSADIIGIFSKELKEFMLSNSDEIPKSLKQISKITNSAEFSESIVKVTSALTIGILRGYCNQETEELDSDLFDQVLNKLFSDAGCGFASVIVGNFSRNLVLTFCSVKQGYSVPEYVDTLIGNCVQVFVSTAVTVYLDKTMNINTYNEIFSGLTNPKNEAKMREMLVTICNGATETFVKTSYQILTSTEMDDEVPISTALTVPMSKRYILDLSGRVVFECVRSFVEKLWECLRRYVEFMNEEVLEWSVEVYRCVSCKYSAVVSVCLTLCVDILNAPWILVMT